MEIIGKAPLELRINLGHLEHNYWYFHSMLQPDTKVMAMVKADAYGCGTTEIAQRLSELKVGYLGVAYTTEGVELRKAGISVPIMIMNPLPYEFDTILEYDLEPEISSPFLIGQWIHFIRNRKIKDYPIHLKLETGMNRLGFMDEEMDLLLTSLKENPEIRITSVLSHLSSSPLPESDRYTKQQFHRFDQKFSKIRKVLNYSPDRHILNSAGIVRFPEHQYEMVRLGIGLYGVGLEHLPVQKVLKPVQTLIVRITQIKRVHSGEGISYSRNEVIDSDRDIAILQMGYADGLLRLAGNHRFSVWIAGHLYPVTGNVCMDMAMIDVTGSENIHPGTYVEIYGENHPVIHLANAGKTIPYEILTGNHRRARRVIIP